jgi:uncharacterized protein (DUF302 family)
MRENGQMTQTTQINIEHVVMTSDRPYEQVIASLEAQMSTFGKIDEPVAQLATAKASWEDIRQTLEKRMGSSGFTIFGKVEQGQLLSLAGRPMRASQYAIGNPLLAIQMIEYAPEVALYAPLRLAVHEDDHGATCISYDKFTSVVARYLHPAIAPVANTVQQKLEALVASALGE